MNIKIHRYKLVPPTRSPEFDKDAAELPFVVRMPKEAVLLHAELYKDDLSVWAEFRQEMADVLVERKFHVVPTGVPVTLPPSAKYFCTVISREDQLIFHIYEQAW